MKKVNKTDTVFKLCLISWIWIDNLSIVIEQEREICKALGSELIGINSELPSEDELKSFKLYLDKIEAEKVTIDSAVPFSHETWLIFANLEFDIFINVRYLCS